MWFCWLTLLPDRFQASRRWAKARSHAPTIARRWARFRLRYAASDVIKHTGLCSPDAGSAISAFTRVFDALCLAGRDALLIRIHL